MGQLMEKVNEAAWLLSLIGRVAVLVMSQPLFWGAVAVLSIIPVGRMLLQFV